MGGWVTVSTQVSWTMLAWLRFWGRFDIIMPSRRMLLLLLSLKRARVGTQAASIRIARTRHPPWATLIECWRARIRINWFYFADGLVEFDNVPSLLIQLILEFLAECHLIKQAWSESPGWTLILTHPPIHPVKCKWSKAQLWWPPTNDIFKHFPAGQAKKIYML